MTKRFKAKPKPIIVDDNSEQNPMSTDPDSFFLPKRHSKSQGGARRYERPHMNVNNNFNINNIYLK
jgi:hypothetical protein